MEGKLYRMLRRDERMRVCEWDEVIPRVDGGETRYERENVYRSEISKQP